MAADVSVSIHTSDGQTLIANLTEVSGINFREQHNEVGSGEFTLHTNNPDLLSIADWDIARFTYNGVDEFAIILRDFEQETIHEDNAQTLRVYKGNGVLSLLDTAVIRPERGLDEPSPEERMFGWPSIHYVETPAWTTATQIIRQDAIDTYVPGFKGYTGYPISWPDPTAFWTWSRARGTAPQIMPEGTSYFRKEFTVAPADDGQAVAIFFAVDNFGEVWLDGELVFEVKPEGSNVGLWKNMYQIGRVLASGDHIIAVLGTHENVNTTNNGAAFILAMMELSVENEVLGDVILHSDNTWSALDYPATPPGMTAGTIARLVITEAQVDNALEGITLSFSDTVDTDGAAWDQVLNLRFDVGTKVIDVMRTVVEQAADHWMNPDLTYDLYNQDAKGSDLTGTISLIKGTHFNSLRHAHTAAIANFAMMRFHTSIFTGEDDLGSILVHGRREIFLSTPIAPNETQARRLAQAIFETYAEPVDIATFTVERYDQAGVLLVGEQPFTDWGLSDLILMPDRDLVAIETKVLALTVNVDEETGKAVFVCEGSQGEPGGS